MKLYLHRPEEPSKLSDQYKLAFRSAVELYIVSAYLTEWDKSLALNKACKKFKIIIGKDFGITRKVACEALLKWLPSRRKTSFMVADDISGFHPKAVFWKEGDGNCYAIVGSSNLTKAAFESNYEVNIFWSISAEDFVKAKSWVVDIERRSVVVSEDWIDEYQEAKRPPNSGLGKGRKQKSAAVVQFHLPKPPRLAAILRDRRDVLRNYNKIRAKFEKLFMDCANGKISNEKFYQDLPKFWRYPPEPATRVQGRGWERTGASSNFREIADSFLKIVQASEDERDEVVSQQIDRLHDAKNPARGAFFSEMLCLRFPDLYPILNRPIWEFISGNKFKAPRGASEGERYIDLAKKLRASLAQNPSHPAKNLLELDGVIWLKYG